ncbi:MAG: 3-deoxy-8-phosphooctulonate synthase, partial [Bacteroidia bacterium]|nr:3-deoxy-8-phosphooctulonate synthase [Bacteroidia bacterium]
MNKSGINIPGIRYGKTDNFLLIAGPCVVESEGVVFEIAEHLVKLSEKYKLPYIFKASYRKANRSKIDSFAGIGDLEALKILAEVKKRYSVPVITDIHNPEEAAIAAQYVDVLQIPAFLCRQ